MKLAVTLFLFSTVLFATNPAPSLTEEKPGNAVEVGGSFQVLVPNDLPDFVRTVPVYGPLVGIPLGERTKIELQAVYGGAEGISLFLTEANLRYHLPTPFVTVFALAGAGYLHHGSNQKDHSYVTPVGGLGFYFPMTKNFYIAMRMKVYLPEKTFINFGGQFGYLLQ